MSPFGSCYVKHTGTPAGYEIIEYPVENGIGTEYHPSRLLLCDNNKWILSASHKQEKSSTFFTTSDGGRNWEKKFSPGGGWNCNNIVIQDSILYCSFYDLVRRGVTVNRGRVMSSTDFGSTWKDHLLLNDEVQQLLVADNVVYSHVSRRRSAPVRSGASQFALWASASDRLRHVDSSPHTLFFRLTCKVPCLSYPKIL